MQNLSSLKEELESFEKLSSKSEELTEFFQIISSDQDPMAEDLQKESRELTNELAKLELAVYLSGEYDRHNAIFSLHAGAGGVDSQDWTEMLMRMYLRYCERKNFKCEIVDTSFGDEAGLKSATIIISGHYAYGLLKAEKGIHRLVRLSPFDANHKRHTSFAMIDVVPEIEGDCEGKINPDDLRIETYRASGAGGQHVNKTDSAVRITHLPTGIVIQCQNERSQHSNKQTALKILHAKLAEKERELQREKMAKLRGEHKDIAWGNQIRSYVFHPYSLVKDHRTNTETGNMQAVIDGDLDLFITSFLKNIKL